MGYLYHKIEEFVDHLVLPAVLVLLVVIILEFFFHDIAEHYHTYILIADYIILSIFAIDLVFKYIRVRNIPKFIRKYWLDIIAIFPFFLFFRVFETLILFTELQKDIKNIQLVFHETLEITKGTSNIIKEAEAAGKISRVKTIIRMFEGLKRTPRLAKAAAFYEHPKGTKHLGSKAYKKVKKGSRKIEQVVADDTESIIKKILRKKK